MAPSACDCTPRYQVYYDNSTSKPNLDFGEDDHIVERGDGVPRLAAKLDELREHHDVCTLMSGDTFHASAVTTASQEVGLHRSKGSGSGAQTLRQRHCHKQCQ